ncbi:MAG: hypothetical protein ACREVL_09235 [Solimonas sp.]
MVDRKDNKCSSKVPAEGRPPAEIAGIRTAFCAEKGAATGAAAGFSTDVVTGLEAAPAAATDALADAPPGSPLNGETGERAIDAAVRLADGQTALARMFRARGFGSVRQAHVWKWLRRRAAPAEYASTLAALFPERISLRRALDEAEQVKRGRSAP